MVLEPEEEGASDVVRGTRKGYSGVGPGGAREGSSPKDLKNRTGGPRRPSSSDRGAGLPGRCPERSRPGVRRGWETKYEDRGRDLRTRFTCVPDSSRHPLTSPHSTFPLSTISAQRRTRLRNRKDLRKE